MKKGTEVNGYERILVKKQTDTGIFVSVCEANLMEWDNYLFSA